MSLGIPANFRERFIDLLAAASLATSWPRADPGDDPDVRYERWYSGDATYFLAAELVSRLDARTLDYRGSPVVDHFAYEAVARYRVTVGLTADHSRVALRPDVRDGPINARYYMNYSPPSRHGWPNVRVPKTPLQSVGVSVEATNAIIQDLVAEIGEPAFAAARAPFLSHLQAAWPGGGFV